MDMGLVIKNIQEKSFLLTGFLLGSLGPLYGKTFNFFLLALIVLCMVTNWRVFVENMKEGKKYILIFFAYFMYISIYTLVMAVTNRVKQPSYGIFEDLLLNFLLVPIYVITLKEYMTPKLLKQFLLFFCLGCFLLNVYILFDLVGMELFTNTRSAVESLYSKRFGENKRAFLGGNLFLEPQTFYIALTALLSYFMVFINRRYWLKVACGVMFCSLLCFLSFTVTKAGILAFFVGFVLINVYIFLQSKWEKRLVILGCTFLLILGAFLFDDTQGQYQVRMEQVVREVENVRQGVYQGGTIAPRVGFIRESFIHADEFAIWGLGVNAKNEVREWLQNTDAGLGDFTNMHNSFIHYWIQGGLFGLGMVLFLFFAPFYRMIKNKRISYLVSVLVIIILIMNNTCVLLALNNTRLEIILLLAMFYFYSDDFACLEDPLRRKSRLLA